MKEEPGVQTVAVGTRAHAAVLAFCGVVIIVVVGLLHDSNLHNAFHDVRHGFSFPCH